MCVGVCVCVCEREREGVFRDTMTKNVVRKCHVSENDTFRSAHHWTDLWI